MRCVICGEDAKKKDRDANRGACPKCSHPFVADPGDGFTDVAIATAVTSVGGDGQFHFLTEHLAYELRRRLARKRRRGSVWVAGMVVLPLGLLLVGVHWNVGALKGIGAVATFFGTFVALAFAAKSKATSKLSDLARRWLEVNRPANWIEGRRPNLKPRAAPDAVRHPAPGADLGAASFDRLLVVDRDEYVDFFLANNFHFHYSCPVLSLEKHPVDVFPDMMRRLLTNPKLQVFALHDATPRGLTLAGSLKRSPEWFAGRPVTIIDLGLCGEQRSMFERVLRPLADFSPDRGTVPGLPPGMGVEVTVMRPEALLRASARGLEELKPFHLLTAASASSADGGGVG